MIDFGRIVALLRDTKWTASLQAVTIALATAAGASGELVWMVVSLVIGAIVTIAGSQRDNQNAKAASSPGQRPSSYGGGAAFFLAAPLLGLTGCAGLFGAPDEVRDAWTELETLNREAIEVEQKREARELEIFALLQPADEEARIEKARLQMEIEQDNERAAQARESRLELLRAVAAWVNAPGLFGSPEDQARADERLLGLIRAVKAATAGGE